MTNHVDPLIAEARNLVNTQFKQQQLESIANVLTEIEYAESIHKKNMDRLTNCLNMRVNAKTIDELQYINQYSLSGRFPHP